MKAAAILAISKARRRIIYAAMYNSRFRNPSQARWRRSFERQALKQSELALRSSFWLIPAFSRVRFWVVLRRFARRGRESGRPMGSGIGLFLRQAVGAFYSTGAVCPSSGFLARAMVRPLERRAGAAPLRVLEAGPGTGVFSRRIAQRLQERDRLDLVELNPRFAQWMREWAERLPSEGPRAQVFHEDILRFEPEAPYDFVVSGLPLNNFPPALADDLLGKLVELGRPGAFITFFQYLGLRRMKSAFAKRERRQTLQRLGAVIDGWIERHGVGVERVWLNVPPAGVYCLQKRERPSYTSRHK